MPSQRRIPEEDLELIFQATKELWQDKKGSAFFLTGGTGFFGKWLTESFIYINRKLGLDARLTVLSRNPEGFLEEFPFYRQETSVHFIQGDIGSFAYPDGKFDYIIHAATDADAQVNTFHPLKMMDTITVGTRRMLDFAVENNPKSFLFTSSGAVYGKQPGNVTHTRETDSFPVNINDPVSAYAEGKRIAELYCSTYYHHRQVPVKIARCFAFVGPYLPLDKHFAIGNFILNAIREEDIVIKGDGTPYRSYLYAADLAVWLWTILFAGENNVPYNVGSDDDHPLAEIAEKVAELNPKIYVKILKKKEPGQPVERYVPNISLAVNKLKLKVTCSLAESIHKTRKFYDPN